MNTLTDNVIMLKVKAGNLDLMGLLFKRHHKTLFNFLYHMTYQRDVAEDMVQQVFYRMLKYRDSFTGSGEFLHWMYTIARNVIKDQGRRRKLPMAGDHIDDIVDMVPGHTHVEEALERKQSAEQLRKAISTLNEGEREILSLSRFQELKHQEVAEILGISEGAVKVRLHRAMHQLKQVYLTTLNKERYEM
ncbi:RNA polymerase sigma factor [Mucilaginibacter calamicampi]